MAWWPVPGWTPAFGEAPAGTERRWDHWRWTWPSTTSESLLIGRVLSVSLNWLVDHVIRRDPFYRLMVGGTRSDILLGKWSPTRAQLNVINLLIAQFNDLPYWLSSFLFCRLRQSWDQSNINHHRAHVLLFLHKECRITKYHVIFVYHTTVIVNKNRNYHVALSKLVCIYLALINCLV
jgi:hypothetical protein